MTTLSPPDKEWSSTSTNLQCQRQEPHRMYRSHNIAKHFRCVTAKSRNTCLLRPISEATRSAKEGKIKRANKKRSSIVWEKESTGSKPQKLQKHLQSVKMKSCRIWEEVCSLTRETALAWLSSVIIQFNIFHERSEYSSTKNCCSESSSWPLPCLGCQLCEHWGAGIPPQPV